MFQKATKHQVKLRLALVGPSGSGKTYSALSIASNLGEKIAVIDTERGSASLYSDIFNFDVCEPESFNPLSYISMIEEADTAGYDVLVIDSLSHAWMGKDGALELVDQAAKKSQSNNSFAAWREVTPLHNQLVDTMLGCHMHVIVTMRAKTEYAMEKDERGRTSVRKIGLAPVQRDGLEFEFTVVGDMDLDHNLIVSKTRCPALSGKLIPKPGENVAQILMDWLNNGEPVPEPIRCEDCKKPIVPACLGSKSYTAEELAAHSKEKYGNALCLGCIKERAAIQKREKEEAAAAQSS